MPALDLVELLREASRLASEAAEAAARGDVDAAFRLHEAAEEAGRRARRLGRSRERRAALPVRRESGRQRAVAALTEMGVVTAPKEIAAYAVARSGAPFDVRALASIRRDEQRSWRSGSRRDVYVVPALEGPWLVAGRGRFGLSSWPLWQRIVGPLSPRADHLRACRSIARQASGLRPLDEEAAQRLLGLLAGYARSIPGAIELTWGSEPSIDAERVLAVVEEELAPIGEEDEGWRRQQAERAQRQLSEEQCLWGASAPALVESGGEA